MISQAYVAEMAAYNAWQNETLYRLCDEIGDAERRRDRGMFFGSIHHTLDHIVMVNEALLIYLENGRPPPSSYRDIVRQDWDALKAEQAAQDRTLTENAARWTEAWLAENCVMNSPRLTEPIQRPRWIMVVQIFSHQTHHRSQVTSELHKMGLNYGGTDIPFRPGAVWQ